MTKYKKINNSDSELTFLQKKELDKRLANHKAGKLKYYTIDELKILLKNKNRTT